MTEDAADGARTIKPPAEEALDVPRLAAYLHRHLDLPDAPLAVERFTGGFANLTYLLRCGDTELVLRRPPLGPVPAGAHDMRREHAVLSRLPDAYPLAPRSVHLCEDESVAGSVFLIAERRRGINVTTELPARFQGQPALNRRIGDMLVDALADLHQVDPAAVGLDTLGKPDGFTLRQLDGWARRWEAAIDRPFPQTESVLSWLRRDVPAPQRAALLHNDYKLDNLLVDAGDPGTPVAVLDWDMCTRGDPLLDLGYVLNYWVEPDDPPAWRAAGMPFWHPGFPSRAEAVARYAARTGLRVDRVRWYLVFAVFKLAVIIQQIYIRFVRGQTTDARFAGFGQRVAMLVDKAEVLAARDDPTV